MVALSKQKRQYTTIVNDFILELTDEECTALMTDLQTLWNNDIGPNKVTEEIMDVLGSRNVS